MPDIVFKAKDVMMSKTYKLSLLREPTFRLAGEDSIWRIQLIKHKKLISDIVNGTKKIKHDDVLSSEKEG